MKRLKIGLTILVFLTFTKSIFGRETPDTVQIGTYLINIHDINFHQKEYVARFWVWMKYDKAEFDFAHRIEVPNAKNIEIQDQIIDSTEDKIWVLMKLRCVMKQSWMVDDFPFDNQHLTIKVENSEFDTRRLVFSNISRGSHYDPNLVIDDWIIDELKTSVNKSTYSTDFGDSSLEKPESEYAAYLIEIDIFRNAWGLFLKIFVGMYIAFMIAYVSFFLNLDSSEARFSLPVGGLFGTVGNKYIIDSNLPETASFTLVDTLHSATFLAIFAIVAFSVFSTRYSSHGKSEKGKKLDNIGKWAVLGFFIAINIVFIGIAILK